MSPSPDERSITGSLTPRSNDTVLRARFSGGFGQPSGFASVLEADVRRGGDVGLTLHFRTGLDGPMNQMWSVMLTNEQRKELAKLLLTYDPTLVEYIDSDTKRI